MKRTIIGLLIAVLAIGGWECNSAPKSQCQDGSTKVQVHNGKSTTYHCHNGEWIKGK